MGGIVWGVIININNAIIVAAGKGMRLRPLTNYKPKCLVEINGRALLSYQLEAIIDNNIENLAIVIGYRGDMIIDFINSNKYNERLNITFIENIDYEITGSCYSLHLCKDFLHLEGYIHINSDLIFNSNTLKLLLNDNNENSIITTKPVMKNDDMVRFKCNSLNDINKIGRPFFINNPDGYLMGPMKLSHKGQLSFINLIETRIQQKIMDM